MDLWLSARESVQIESKMSEEERSDPVFFPEHLHVLREKLESNRKRSHGRSVGELPGRSRKRHDQKVAQNDSKYCTPSFHNVHASAATPATKRALTTDVDTKALQDKLKHMEDKNEAMMKQVSRPRVASVRTRASCSVAVTSRFQGVPLPLQMLEMMTDLKMSSHD